MTKSMKKDNQLPSIIKDDPITFEDFDLLDLKERFAEPLKRQL